MLFVRFIQLMGIVLGVSALVYFISSMFLGPGVQDFSLKIVGGYSYEDTGGNEKHILYSHGKGLPKIVIDSRVDDYKVDGEMIYVARRPVEYYREGDVLKSRIINICEYWLINVSNNNIEKTDLALPLSCK